MKKNLLIASGCSYTDEKYISFDKDIPETEQSGWDFWPKIMADELGLDYINKARAGAGNQHVFNSLIEEIIKYGDRVHTVAVLWTGSDRLPLFDHWLNPIVELQDNKRMGWPDDYDPFLWQEYTGIGKVSKKYFASKSFSKKCWKTMIQDPLKYMAALIDLCRSRDIKLIMGQGIMYYNNVLLDFALEDGNILHQNYINENEAIEYFLNNPMFSYLEKNKDIFVGWPLLNKLGGTNFEVHRHNKEEYFISKKDRHPNAKGQKLFADIFLERYKQIYG